MNYKSWIKFFVLLLALSSAASCASTGAVQQPPEKPAEKVSKPLPEHADQAYLHYMQGYMAERGGDFQSAVNEYQAASRIVAMSFCEPRSWTRVLSS